MAIKTGDLTQSITIRVSEKMKAHLLLKCIEQNITVADLIRQIIEEYLKEGE